MIREALHVLQGEGIVVAKPYCARTVFDLAPDQVSELVVMRASLESCAAYLAAQKMTKKWASAILSAASRFIDEPPESYSDWVDRELTFHRTVWEASGNEWLVKQLLQCSLPTFAARIVGRGDTDVHHLWQQCRVRTEETHKVIRSWPGRWRMAPHSKRNNSWCGISGLRPSALR